MRYVITLGNIARADYEKLGFRAADLAVLKEKGFNIPLTFVVNNEALDEFLADNGLKIKIERAILEKDPDTTISSLFAKAKIPKELEEELIEAYESLTIEPGSPASSLVSEFNAPFVMLVRSPAYLLDTDDEEGVIQNVKGIDSFLENLKAAWASLYSTKSMAYRRKHGISGSFSSGMIVEKMKRTKASAIGYSRSDFDDFTSIIKAYKGLPDLGDALLGKDYYEVDHNTLSIKKNQVNVQEHEWTRDISTGLLVKRPLLQEAGMQKVNDKIISELARISKRSKSFIGKDVKIHFGIMDEYVYILCATRMSFHPKARVEEQEEIRVSIEENGSRRVEEQHTANVMQTDERDNKLVLPEIISKDEAKEEVLRAAPDKVFSLTGFDPAGESPIPSIVEQEEETPDEKTLIQEVLTIKELADKMEEHARNGNKEAYDRESRLLQDLLEKANEKI